MDFMLILNEVAASTFDKFKGVSLTTVIICVILFFVFLKVFRGILRLVLSLVILGVGGYFLLSFFNIL